jgi:hypothetical protein
MSANVPGHPPPSLPTLRYSMLTVAMPAALRAWHGCPATKDSRVVARSVLGGLHYEYAWEEMAA